MTADKKYPKPGKLETMSMMSEYEKKIAEALALQGAIDNKKERLDEIKQFFADEVSSGKISDKTLATSVGTMIYTTSNSYSVKPENIDVLKKIFKTTYGQFVDEKLSFGCTAKLKKLLSDGDFKQIEAVREAVSIKESVSVKFKAVSAN